MNCSVKCYHPYHCSDAGQALHPAPALCVSPPLHLCFLLPDVPITPVSWKHSKRTRTCFLFHQWVSLPPPLPSHTSRTNTELGTWHDRSSTNTLEIKNTSLFIPYTFAYAIYLAKHVLPFHQPPKSVRLRNLVSNVPVLVLFYSLTMPSAPHFRLLCTLLLPVIAITKWWYNYLLNPASSMDVKFLQCQGCVHSFHVPVQCWAINDHNQPTREVL